MKIKYFAWLKDITKTDLEEIENIKIKNTKELVKFICSRHPKLKPHFKDNMIRIAVNLKYISSNKNLLQNDEVAFFPPVSGG